jgi:predicted permease
MLRKSPVLSGVAVLALTLGIGANATVFTIVNAFLFQNLPLAGSDRILYISSVNNTSGKGRGVSYLDFRDLQAESKSFESVGAFAGSDLDLSDRTGLPAQYKGARLTANAFSIIGQRPVVGRDFVVADTAANAAPVAILSYKLWQDRYGKDPTIIGASIRINEIPTVVAGVMPPGIHFPGASQLWVPLVPGADLENRSYRPLTVFGRLTPASSIASARAELVTIAGRLEHQYPATNQGTGLAVKTYNDYFTDTDTRLVYLALVGAVGFVLLIACANVANLLLTRSATRAREIYIRTALGAGRWRVVRQLLVESLLLSAVGGILGAAAGLAGVRMFVATLISEDVPAHLHFGIDWRVLAYLAAITVVTGILFGLAPALRLARLDFDAALRTGGYGSSTGAQARRFSSALVIGEVALAFVLLVGAGLMIRSFLNMAHTPMGVRTDHLMSMDILLRPRRYPAGASQIAFHRELRQRLEALPGVKTVAMASNLPGDGWTDFNYEIEGAAAVDPRTVPRTGGVVVSPEYFPMLEIYPRRGRVLTSLDGLTGVPVVVVNETFARMCWPNQDPVGRRIRVVQRGSGTAPAFGQQPWLTVVGVVADIVQSDTSQGSHDPLIYIPYQELPQREMVIAARTLVPPESLEIAFRQQVQILDGDLPVTDMRTLDQLLWERTRSWRVYGTMFSIFAAIALIMASVGLYGVLAQSVTQRTREIGIRMAIGASTTSILAMVFTQGMLQVLIGLAAGAAASLALTQVLSSQLVGVSPADPATLAAVGLVLIATGAIGCAIPARRGMSVDPVVALRYE